jgi:hypothetical protein
MGDIGNVVGLDAWRVKRSGADVILDRTLEQDIVVLEQLRASGTGLGFYVRADGTPRVCGLSGVGVWPKSAVASNRAVRERLLGCIDGKSLSAFGIPLDASHLADAAGLLPALGMYVALSAAESTIEMLYDESAPLRWRLLVLHHDDREFLADAVAEVLGQLTEGDGEIRLDAAVVTLLTALRQHTRFVPTGDEPQRIAAMVQAAAVSKR